MKAIGAILEALRALQLDLHMAGIETLNFDGALTRAMAADEEDRAWIRQEIADLKADRENRWKAQPRGMML